MKTAVTSALAFAATLGLATAASAQEHTFKFQSSDPAGNPNFVLQQEWATAVEEQSDGQIQIELLPVESIVAHNETQDAIAAGILDGHITDTSYFAGKDPAFGLIANPVGAWSDPEEMFRFMEEGGGRELMNELVEPYGLHFIGATTPG
ncbi:MAG TPA: C4-dicarboxylate ABC transporter substrate-binding protein, partial [Thermohalobaculum sp.]|nr:C4-dicarboxylate ABC transporter substrate-binding protein [Thermohalobaculum sp.]